MLQLTRRLAKLQSYTQTCVVVGRILKTVDCKKNCKDDMHSAEYYELRYTLFSCVCVCFGRVFLHFAYSLCCARLYIGAYGCCCFAMYFTQLLFRCETKVKSKKTTYDFFF